MDVFVLVTLFILAQTNNTNIYCRELELNVFYLEAVIIISEVVTQDQIKIRGKKL